MKKSFSCMYLAGSTYHWYDYLCLNWYNEIWKHRSRVCFWQALPTIGIIIDALTGKTKYEKIVLVYVSGRFYLPLV